MANDIVERRFAEIREVAVANQGQFERDDPAWAALQRVIEAVDEAAEVGRELAYYRKVIEANAPGMERSSVFLGDWSGMKDPKALDDPVFVLQIGMAVLFDKPLALVVDADMPVSAMLRKIATHIEVATSSEDHEGALTRALTRLTEVMDGAAKSMRAIAPEPYSE